MCTVHKQGSQVHRLSVPAGEVTRRHLLSARRGPETAVVCGGALCPALFCPLGLRKVTQRGSAPFMCQGRRETTFTQKHLFACSLHVLENTLGSDCGIF